MHTLKILICMKINKNSTAKNNTVSEWAQNTRVRIARRQRLHCPPALPPLPVTGKVAHIDGQIDSFISFALDNRHFKFIS